MKKLLKMIMIPLFLAITCVFYLPKVQAQFDPNNEFPLLYLGFDVTNTTLRADPNNADRSILVKTVEFTSPMSAINQLTITFDDTMDLGIGEPAIYFLSGMVDNMGMNTVLMTTMNINANGGIGDNLFYFNYPYNNATTYIIVYISIDKNLDPDYINNQQAIFDAIRFVPLAPYQYTKLLEQYTENEIQEMILLSRYNGYIIGKDEGFEDGYQSAIDEMADIINEDSYDQGYSDGLEATETKAYEQGFLEGSTNSFMANIKKWIVPSIVVVMVLGGFITLIIRKRGE